MSDFSESNLKKIASQNAESLMAISKDMSFLSRKLKKTDFNDTDIFMTNVVQSSFYMNAINIAISSFRKMLKDGEAGKHDKVLLDYFKEEIYIMENSNIEELVDDNENKA